MIVQERKVSQTTSELLSAKSSRSIISQDFLNQQLLNEIKQSKARTADKKVMVWTPVVIGTNFPSHVKQLKLEYNTGEMLNAQNFPADLNKMVGGLILNLPLLSIEQYLAAHLDIGWILSDDELVQFLENWLNKQSLKARTKKNQNQNLSQLMHMPLFENAGS